MKRKAITIGILVGLTIGLYFLFTQIKPLRIFTKNEIHVQDNESRHITATEKVITQIQKKTKNLPVQAKKPEGIDWKNWLLATLTSIVVYAIKKAIDLFFKIKELRLARLQPLDE